ncbi:MAG: hypothetical protein WBM44_20745 [Waterburya sp.]
MVKSVLLGQNPIILYFYPQDNTLGSTAESFAFRDSYEIFQEAELDMFNSLT